MTAWIDRQEYPRDAKRLPKVREPRPKSISRPKSPTCNKLALPPEPLARTVNRADIRVPSTPRKGWLVSE